MNFIMSHFLNVPLFHKIVTLQVGNFKVNEVFPSSIIKGWSVP